MAAPFPAIRLRMDAFASRKASPSRIFPLTKIGMRVVVSYDDVAPVEISHPLLLKPTPPPPSNSLSRSRCPTMTKTATMRASPFEPT